MGAEEEAQYAQFYWLEMGGELESEVVPLGPGAGLVFRYRWHGVEFQGKSRRRRLRIICRFLVLVCVADEEDELVEALIAAALAAAEVAVAADKRRARTRATRR